MFNKVLLCNFVLHGSHRSYPSRRRACLPWSAKCKEGLGVHLHVINHHVLLLPDLSVVDHLELIFKLLLDLKKMCSFWDTGCLENPSLNLWQSPPKLSSFLVHLSFPKPFPNCPVRYKILKDWEICFYKQWMGSSHISLGLGLHDAPLNLPELALDISPGISRKI